MTARILVAGSYFDGEKGHGEGQGRNEEKEQSAERPDLCAVV
jgi:hypothetical protein